MTIVRGTLRLKQHIIVQHQAAVYDPWVPFRCFKVGTLLEWLERENGNEAQKWTL